jgi:hypothetical protein
MDRGTRIAIVVSVAWVALAYLIVDEIKEGNGTLIEDTIVLGLFPVAIYWAYRFIRAGRPSKINQPK